MSEHIIEFQKLRIEALENEVVRLKNQLVQTETKISMSASELKEFINDPAFSKPIHNIDYSN